MAPICPEASRCARPPARCCLRAHAARPSGLRLSRAADDDNRRATIDKLKTDNAQLKDELTLERKNAKVYDSVSAQAQIAKLQDTGDMYTRKIELEKRRIEVCVCAGVEHMHASAEPGSQSSWREREAGLCAWPLCMMRCECTRARPTPAGSPSARTCGLQELLPRRADEALATGRSATLTLTHTHTRMQELDKQMEIMHKKIWDQRQKMGGINASRENNQAIAKQIQILENRLDKALKRYAPWVVCAATARVLGLVRYPADALATAAAPATVALAQLLAARAAAAHRRLAIGGVHSQVQRGARQQQAVA